MPAPPERLRLAEHDFGWPASGRGRTVALALAGAACAAGYAAAFPGEFVFDDRPMILEAAPIRDLGRFLRVDFPAQWRSAQRPIANLSFAVDHALFGFDPLAFHAVSLAAHLAVALLLYALGRMLLARFGYPRSERVSLFAAAAFALHPLCTQAVCYAVQRAEVLSALFYAAALLLFARAARPGAAPVRVAAWLGSLASIALGLGAKGLVVTAPAAFLLALGLEGERETGRWHALGRGLLLVAPALAAIAWFAGASIRVTAGSAAAGYDMPVVATGRYLLTQPRVVLAYLRLALWPAGQSLDHDVPLAQAAMEPGTLAGLVGLALLAAAVGWLLARAVRESSPAARAASFGLTWFLLVLAPTSLFPLPDTMVEHRAYLPLWGVLLAVSAMGAELAGGLPARRASRAVTAAALALLAALWVVLAYRAREWRSAEAIWADAASKSPHRARPRFNLGRARQVRGDRAGARAAFQAAVPWLGDGSLAAHNVGAVYYELGRLDLAEKVLADALARWPRDADILNGLALCEMDRGDLDGAEGHARRAVETSPGNGYARNTLGEILLARGQLEAAEAELRAAVGLSPEIPARWYNLGVARHRLGRDPEACASFTRYAALARGAEDRDDASSALAELGCARR